WEEPCRRARKCQLGIRRTQQSLSTECKAGRNHHAPGAGCGGPTQMAWRLHVNQVGGASRNGSGHAGNRRRAVALQCAAQKFGEFICGACHVLSLLIRATVQPASVSVNRRLAWWALLSPPMPP